MPKVLYLADLKKGREKETVTVRVVRKWTVNETTGQCLPLFVAMVWADAKGNSIYAEIPGTLIPHKDQAFDIGKVYNVNKFRVINAKTTFRPFDASIMVEITPYTEVEVARDPPNTIPHYIYNLTSFSSLEPVERTVHTCTDVIGHITKYDVLETFIPKGKEKVKRLRKLYLKDLRDHEIKITLWGDQAADFNIKNVYDENKGNVVVCLILGCIPRREYDAHEKTYLSASSSCSYYLNPQIPEADPFYIKFKDTPFFISQPLILEEEAPAQLVDKPLESKNLADLNDMNPFDFQDGSYKCAVTITSINEGSNWWYRSCKLCKKGAVQQSDGTYKCPKCLVTGTMNRYLLSFTARDETAEASFFAFDDEAKQIVQRECDAIMSPLATSHGVPQALKDIIGKEYVFSINLKDDTTSRNQQQQYLVKGVLQKPSKRPAATYMITSGSTKSPYDPASVSGTVLQISDSKDKTPSPVLTTDENELKILSLKKTDDVRKNLLTTLNTEEQEEDNEKHPESTNDTRGSSGRKGPTVRQPNTKRTKTKSSKDVSTDE